MLHTTASGLATPPFGTLKLSADVCAVQQQHACMLSTQSLAIAHNPRPPRQADLRAARCTCFSVSAAPEGPLRTESAAAAPPASPEAPETLGTCSTTGSSPPAPAAPPGVDRPPSSHHAAAGRFFFALTVCSCTTAGAGPQQQQQQHMCGNDTAQGCASLDGAYTNDKLAKLAARHHSHHPMQNTYTNIPPSAHHSQQTWRCTGWLAYSVSESVSYCRRCCCSCQVKLSTDFVQQQCWQLPGAYRVWAVHIATPQLGGLAPDQ